MSLGIYVESSNDNLYHPSELHEWKRGGGKVIRTLRKTESSVYPREMEYSQNNFDCIVVSL
jgi:hypothetical protein